MLLPNSQSRKMALQLSALSDCQCQMGVFVVTSMPCPSVTSPRWVLLPPYHWTCKENPQQSAVGPPAAPRGWIQRKDPRGGSRNPSELEQRCQEQSLLFLEDGGEMLGAELTSPERWGLIHHSGWRGAGEMTKLCRGFARTFVPVTYIMTRSSAHVTVCPTQSLKEAVVWAVLGQARGQQGHKLLQDTGVQCMIIYTSCGFIPRCYSCRSTFIPHSCFIPV